MQPHHPLFQTQNTALAVTLATCGVPFAEDEHGHAAPFLNIYDAEILRRHGYGGQPIEQAALDAHRRGIAGKITYNFQRTPALEKVIKGFDSHMLAIRSPELAQLPPPVLAIDEEVAGRLCAQLMFNRKAIIDGWKTAIPMVAIYGAMQKDTSGDRTEVRGSFKVYSLNASELIRAHIHV